MAFVWGDGANNGGADGGEYAMYASIKGTPAAGRQVNAGFWDATGDVWNSPNGDNKCYGEATADCTSNPGIVLAADKKFFFQGVYTGSYDWLINNSYLSHFDTDITMDDVQP